MMFSGVSAALIFVGSSVYRYHMVSFSSVLVVVVSVPQVTRVSGVPHSFDRPARKGIFRVSEGTPGDAKYAYKQT